MSYNGVAATIQAGLGGYNGSVNPDSIPYTDLVTAKNIRYDGNAWRKVPGLEAYGAAVANATAVCLAGIDYKATDTVRRQVTVWSDGKVYKEVSGDLDSVSLTNVALTFTADPILVQCGNELTANSRKLLMFAANTTPYVATADAAVNTLAAISNPSPDWSSTNQPSAGIMHDGRIVAWGNANSPHAIYFSTLNDHTDFLTDLPPVFDIAKGEGDGIRACYSMGSTRLYIFKFPLGIYWIDTTNITSYILPVTPSRRDIGIAGPQAIQRVGSNGVWFIGADAHIYSLNILDNPDVDIKDASITGSMFMSQWLKDNVDMTRLRDAKLLWDSNRKEVIACYTKQGSTYNDLCLVIDLQDPNKPKIAMDDRGSYFEAGWMAQDPTTNYRTLLVGGTGGTVYKANADDRSIGTAGAYTAEVKTPPTNFGWLDPKLAQVRKRFDWLEFTLTDTGNYHGYVSVYVDDELLRTYPFHLGSSSSATLDDVTIGLAPADGAGKTDMAFGSTALLQQKIRIGGIGQRLALKIYNSGLNEDFNISSVRVYFMPLGEYGETTG
jgi:hypothetical protein